MSFDLYFVPRPHDGNWNTVMDQLEAAAGASRSLTTDDLDVWARIMSGVAPLTAAWEESKGDRFRQLSFESTGVQISMSSGEIALTAAYWHTGDEATTVVEQLRRIAVEIERATGLVAFDPQSGGPFLEGNDERVASVFDESAAALRRHLSDGDRAPAQKRRWLFKGK